MGIIYFIILLGCIVLVHELGHLISAKIFHVYCHEFSIGMGPKLFQIKGKETVYSIRLLPLGGYVAMAGEDDVAHPEVDVPQERTIKGVARYKQLIIILSGVLMNFIFSLFIFSGILLHEKKVAVISAPIVSVVSENSPAEKAGLQVDDLLLQITTPAKEVYDLNKIGTVSGLFTSDSVYTLIIERAGQIKEIQITPQKSDDTNRYLIGIYEKPSQVIEVNWLNVIPIAFGNMINFIVLIATALLQLVKGIGFQNLSGPVGIYNITAQQAALGFIPFISLMAVLSLNVAVFNLLPVPALDGGRAIIILFEILIKKELPKKLEYALMIGSWIILLGILIFSTWQDISKLF